MLTCQELTELVTDYAEGHLSLWDRMRFRMHLGMCKHCRAYVHDRKMTVQTVGKLEPEPIPDVVRDELLERFRDWKRDDSSDD